MIRPKKPPVIPVIISYRGDEFCIESVIVVRAPE